LTDNDGLFSFDGYWYDSVYVFVTDLNNQPLLLEMKPSFLNFKYQKSVNKSSVLLKTSTLPILRTDNRRRLYAGNPDFIIKPKDLKDSSSSIIEHLNVKLHNTKVDSAYQFKVIEKIKNKEVYFQIDGQNVNIDALSILSQSQIAQYDLVFKSVKLKGLGIEDLLYINILTKIPTYINQRLKQYPVYKFKGFDVPIKFKSRNRTLSGQGILVYETDVITNAKGEISIKLEPYSKLIPYVVEVWGFDKKGKIFENKFMLND
jgi:hypothetical protein